MPDRPSLKEQVERWLKYGREQQSGATIVGDKLDQNYHAGQTAAYTHVLAMIRAMEGG